LCGIVAADAGDADNMNWIKHDIKMEKTEDG
jgi:hypothetical protein